MQALVLKQEELEAKRVSGNQIQNIFYLKGQKEVEGMKALWSGYD